MKEAYEAAGIPLSKNLTKRRKSLQKKDVINFIKLNPNSTVSEIQKKTSTNIPRLFGSITVAYNIAGKKISKEIN